MEGNTFLLHLIKYEIGQVHNHRKVGEKRRNACQILEPEVRRLQERKGRRMAKVK
jgi:hypothetical protein